ncbi:MAG: GNAT family N-acetyltransferase [Anaerolineaceae bacterium]|nr:GNAT family N-acetyltransferase [Anaerolineaceae bacterium]
MNLQSSENKISLRLMTEKDLHEVEALDKLCFSDPWPQGAFAHELLHSQDSLCLVAENTQENGETGIIAAAVFWLIADELHLGTIAVLPAWRKMKIGLSLLIEGLLRGYQKGAHASLLEVRAGNAAALRLYEGLAYQRVGRRKAYYQDNHEDAILLTLDKIDPLCLKNIAKMLPIPLKSAAFSVESASGVKNAS